MSKLPSTVLYASLASVVGVFANAGPGRAQPQPASTKAQPEAARGETKVEPIASEATPDAVSTSDEPSLVVTAGMAGQVNNLFGALFAVFHYRSVYSEDPESTLFKRLYWQVGAGVVSSVYTNELALHVEWLPIAIAKVRFSYKGRLLTGLSSSFGTGLTFDNKRAPYGEDVLKSREGENISTFWHQMVLEPTLQAKFWRLILLNNFSVTYNYVHGKGDFVYDNLTDSLIRRGAVDWMIQQQPILLFDAYTGFLFDKLYLGVYHQYNLAVRAGIERHRLGGMVLYSPIKRWSVFYEPTLVIMAGADLVDRNRANQGYAFFMLRSGFPL